MTSSSISFPSVPGPPPSSSMRFAAAACLPAHELLLAAASSQQKSLVFYKRSATPEVVINSLTPLLLGSQKLRKKNRQIWSIFCQTKNFHPFYSQFVCAWRMHAFGLLSLFFFVFVFFLGFWDRLLDLDFLHAGSPILIWVFVLFRWFCELLWSY